MINQIPKVWSQLSLLALLACSLGIKNIDLLFINVICLNDKPMIQCQQASISNASKPKLSQSMGQLRSHTSSRDHSPTGETHWANCLAASHLGPMLGDKDLGQDGNHQVKIWI